MLTKRFDLAWLFHGAETAISTIDVTVAASSIGTVELRFRW